MKRTFKFLSVVIIATIALMTTSCGAKLKPLNSSNIKVTPSTLEVVGNEIPFKIHGTFPEKWFNKNAQVSITTVLKYGEKEVEGIPYSFQGEKVLGNSRIISYKNGGRFSLNFKLPYFTEMNKSELFLRIAADIKGRKVTIPDVKVADGLIATSQIASALNVTPALADDGFQRVIKEAQEANILFLIQQADLRRGELTKEDLKEWKNRVKNADKDERQTVNIEISAYASPDGGLSLNDKLAQQREKNTASYLKRELKKDAIDTEINAYYTAQDWDGFQKLVESSNLQDKELVLRVLSMYTDPEVREQEIKNISLVFKDLAETILPQLRRSRLTANIEIIGKSDDEIISEWRKSPKQLSVEEVLYAATLPSMENEAEAIYKFATTNFASDYRGWNNLGTVYYKQGNIDEASIFFKKALAVLASAPEANLNMALLAINKKDISTAEELMGIASGANTFDEAMGLLSIEQGKYAEAVSLFAKTKSNNAALAQLLAKDYSAALGTLDSIANPDAVTYYLKAIVSSRTNNMKDVLLNLNASISKDATMAKKAALDLEFAKYRTNNSFMSLTK